MSKKFMYVGDKEEVKLYGHTFPKGEAVEVDPKEMQPLGKKNSLVSIVDKLSGNAQFEIIEAKPAKKSPAKKAKPKIVEPE